MKRYMSRSAILIVLLLGLVLLLVGCQRERPPEEAGADWSITPGVQPTATVAVSAILTPAQGTTVVAVEGEQAGGQDGALQTNTPEVQVQATAQAPDSTGGVVIPVGPTFEYLVQSGDTLFSIAQLYSADVDTLRRLNNLPDDTIQIGQVLKVPGTGQLAAPTTQPGSQPSPTELPPAVVYVVELGDTLSAIALQFDVNWQDIAAANGIAGPNYNIYRGQQLVIPGVVPTPVPTAEVAVHVVQQGETMYSIAIRYGVTLQALMVANQIANPDLIFVGQQLIVPE